MLLPAGDVTQTGEIVAGGLELTGTGAYTLTDADNNITTLAAATSAAAEAVTYNDSNDLAVGTV